MTTQKRTGENQMKPYKKAFERWFDEYFCDTQGEDSPYSYNDIVEAFKAGMKEKGID